MLRTLSNKPRDLGKIQPINYKVVARSHTPVYKIHRYFARRPWSVFNELIKYYSNPGDIILDTFCGGGVTVIEGLRLRRKTIGIDLNPMATFITKCEALHINLKLPTKEMKAIEKDVKEEIERFYLTECPKCKSLTPFKWMKLSHVYACPNCGKAVIISKAHKQSGGRYICYNCRETLCVTDAKKIEIKPIQIGFECINPKCRVKGEKEPTNLDLKNIEKIKKNFTKIVKAKKLWFPKDKMPMNYDLRRPYNYKMKYFVDFLTKRNLLSLSILFKRLKQIKNKDVRYIMMNVFTSTLSWSTKLCLDPGHGWPMATYWVADLHYELNVWKQFEKRFEWLMRGKEYSEKEIGNYYKEANSFKDFKNGKVVWILNKSSTNIPLPDNSVDAIITDPPYGGNVKYGELCNFYIIWLRDLFKINGLMDNSEEAIISKFQKKDSDDYGNLLYQVFNECYRVLKPNRWMVMTFNNKVSSVWTALLRATRSAGFYLPDNGIIYQTPIKHYTNTLCQRRDGSVLGDFIYSFQKKEYNKDYKKRSIQNHDFEELIFKKASKIIEEKNGVVTSEIFQELIPALFNSDLIIGEKQIIPNIEKVLKKYFHYTKVNNTKKWINKI